MKKYLKDNAIKNEVKGIIIDRLDAYQGETIYGCDLGYKLFESENVDGSYTYNTHEAEKWIKENFDNLGEIVEERTFQLGSECIPNIFDKPEAFQVVIFLEVSRYLIGQCSFIEENWDEEIEFTSENIAIIKSQLNNIK